jgi:hypothetical protein
MPLASITVAQIIPRLVRSCNQIRRRLAFVTQMLELHPRLRAAQTAHDCELLQRQIDATDAQIDALVYELYGLTEEEIKVVEGEK